MKFIYADRKANESVAMEDATFSLAAYYARFEGNEHWKRRKTMVEHIAMAWDVLRRWTTNHRAKLLHTTSQSGLHPVFPEYVLPSGMKMYSRSGKSVCAPVGSNFPCKKCGAEKPTADGDDPCIANLPGVKHACCGHGTHSGYVVFENGRVIRGDFEDF